MHHGSTIYTYEWEVEGDNEEHCVYTFDINYSYAPGEDTVMYDTNGTGNPGSGPEIEIDEIILVAVSINGETVDSFVDISKEWEQKFQQHIDTHWDDFYGRLCDDVAADMEGAEDAYWDERYNQMRDKDLL